MLDLWTGGGRTNGDLDRFPYAFDDIGVGIDSNLDINSIDLNFLRQYNEAESPPETPIGALADDSRTDHASDARAEIPTAASHFTSAAGASQDSLWQRRSGTQDHRRSDLPHFTTPISAPRSQQRFTGKQIFDLHIDHPSRERVLGMLMATCEPADVPLLESSFPPPEVLEVLVHSYLVTVMSQNDSWLHNPTMHAENMRPELLGALIAAGAITSFHSSFRKLGYAIADRLRCATAKAVRKFLLHHSVF